MYQPVFVAQGDRWEALDTGNNQIVITCTFDNAYPVLAKLLQAIG
jgi:hypothetical protein